MSINIAEFSARVSQVNGFQKLNRFKVLFPVPPGLLGQQQSINGSSALDTVRYMEFWTNTTDVPGMSLLTRPINRYGYGGIEKKPSATTYNDIMMTFYNDTGSVNLQFFHDWFRLINNTNLAHGVTDQFQSNHVPTAPWELSYKGEYSVDPEIILYDIAGAPQYTIKLRECYPIEISHTKMLWEPQPTIMQIVVMFTYYDWYHLDSPSSDNPQSPSIPGLPILGPIFVSSNNPNPPAPSI